MQICNDANPATSKFLLRLYGGVTNSDGWKPALDELRDEMGVHSVVVQGLSLEGSRAATFWIAHDSRTDMAAYRAMISDAGNPRMEGKRFANALDRLVDDNDLFATEERPIRERLQQQLVAIGCGQFLGALVPLSERRYMALALHREVGDRCEFSDQQRSHLATLLPHFAQALQLSQAVTSSRSAEALLRGHLDRAACGLVVCDVDGRVLWLNKQARSELSNGDGLRIRDGLLHISNAEARQLLRDALLRQVARTSPGFLALNVDGDRLQLAFETLDPTGTEQERVLLVALTRDQPAWVVPAEWLAVLFDLTHAESLLASALVAGLTLEEYAQRRRVGIGTVRFQLKQVLAKTGTHRQADLVRRVLCSAAAYVVDPNRFRQEVGRRLEPAVEP